ncbi:uncharacterized protein A4U43_C07F36910 [Asparagus officinalis]|uniref:peptidylprolyl isomerase n=1 Tax=Asparagus officinalis TaxID=4686 RepID=A0A5P1EN02_ASPOF|nr:peptidyl-prolyl cis-trans isomerase FKBP17-2, chloroplastic [Asparagus officinalis]ONK65420.1 uncharacterized protein A4U43_C07F36910 [Asparagus officinalis]
MAAFLGSPAINLPRPLLSKTQLANCTSQQGKQQTQSQPQTQANQPLIAKPEPGPTLPKPKSVSTPAESTDWIASSLTRRFGLGAGLAWVGFLAFGVVSEQIKTRFEASQQEANTKDAESEVEVALPNGIRYYDIKVGGGATLKQGDLIVIDLKGKVAGSNEEEFVNTFEQGKRPLALVVGSRPYTKGMCEGIEYVLRTMRAGGKRRVIVPAALGFGDEGADLGEGHRIPPSATLEFVVQVDRVSIAPA